MSVTVVSSLLSFTSIFLALGNLWYLRSTGRGSIGLLAGAWITLGIGWYIDNFIPQG